MHPQLTLPHLIAHSDQVATLTITRIVIRIQQHVDKSLYVRSSPSNFVLKQPCQSSTLIISRNSTGSTGYIGGDVLYALEKAHPEWEYTALVRNSDKGAPVAAAYPSIRLVYGTLDDAELLEAETASADIIVRK